MATKPKCLAPDQAVLVIPRPAATTLVVRDSERGLEVLMVRRSLTATFMPGAYVFPGGAVDDSDATCIADETPDVVERRVGKVAGVEGRASAYAVAALRECFEECGIWLTAAVVDRSLDSLRRQLHEGASFGSLASSAGLSLETGVLKPWSRWVTPLGRSKRFDALFFVAKMPAGQSPAVDSRETTTLAWIHPLDISVAGGSPANYPMEFATLQTIKSLQPYANGTQVLFDYADTLLTVPKFEPRLQLDEHGYTRAVLLPGNSGYEKAFGAGLLDLLPRPHDDWRDKT